MIRSIGLAEAEEELGRIRGIYDEAGVPAVRARERQVECRRRVET